MLSIIVCSVRPERLKELEENISRTIGDGVEYEIIAIPNKENPRSLTAVYNEGGARAKYPYLLFIHEDAGFITKNWWPTIEQKLREPDCGVIGFAGTRVMLNLPTGWGVDLRWMLLNLYESGKEIKLLPSQPKDFEEVVAMDGFALFVRKDVWEEVRFDDVILKGFHCYDVDFTLCVAQHYRNYVCTCIDVYHNSKGSFNEDWLRTTFDIYMKKWKNMLPLTTSEIQLTEKEVAYVEERVCFRMIKFLKSLGLPTDLAVKEFKKFPMTWRHFEHTIKLFKMGILKPFAKK